MVYGSSVYGVSAWYNYLLLLLAVSLPPLLLARCQDFPWKSYARLLWPIIAVVNLPHRPHRRPSQRRSLHAPDPPYLALLAPFSAHLFARRPRSWRAYGFGIINGAFILLIAASPSQNNIIALVRYLGEHPSIQQVWALGAWRSTPPPIVRERQYRCVG